MRLCGLAGVRLAGAGLLFLALQVPAWGGDVAPYPKLFPGPAHGAAALPAPVSAPAPAPAGAGKAAGASAFPANPNSEGFRLGVTAATVGVVGLLGLAVVAISAESSRAVSGVATGVSSSTPGT